ncbi:hypothetical protein HPB47_001189, partial [Ixodes persulcatus]
TCDAGILQNSEHFALRVNNTGHSSPLARRKRTVPCCEGCFVIIIMIAQLKYSYEMEEREEVERGPR